MSDLSSPLVSVGVCAYNRPDGLRDTLRCLTNQTHKNLEIIVSQDFHPVEDFSNIISEFQDPRIKFYKQSYQLFMNKNFEFVLNKSTGDFFMWAADDDLWEKSFIEECLKKFSNSDVLLVTPSANVVDKEGNIIRSWKENSRFVELDRTKDFKKFVRSSFSENIAFYGLFDGNYLRRKGIYNCFANDQLLVAQTILDGKIEQVETVIFHYRLTGSSAISKESYLRAMGLKGFKRHYCYTLFFLIYIKIVFFANGILWSKKFRLVYDVYKLLFNKGFFKAEIKNELRQTFKKKN